MKTIEEMLAVMQAYADGKKIECAFRDRDVWWDVVVPCWDWNNYDFRVKPEPKYRPYKDAEECFTDVKKHGGWVKNTSGQYLHILAVGESSMVYSDNITFPHDRALRYWVWADDFTPCGVLEED